MNILELFSGTGSFSKVARERGHQTFTVDIDSYFKPDLCKDILELNIEDIPFKPDVIWSSPPCQKFSVMTIGKSWIKNEDGSYTPRNEEVVKHLELHRKGLEIIKSLNPKFFFIENPRAMLRKMDFMKDIQRKTVTYCKYGFMYQKATDIWTNVGLIWISKQVCSPGDDCHESQPRGYEAKKNSGAIGKGTQGMKDAKERAQIPKELCLEIIKCLEVSHKHH